MNPIRTRVAGIAALTLGALVATAPVTTAQGTSATFSVSPPQAKAGTKVELRLNPPGTGCSLPGPPSSTALSGISALQTNDTSLNAWEGVVKNVKPGRYAVTSTCKGGVKATGSITVTGGSDGRAQVGTKPRGGAQTGGGGTADGGAGAVGVGALAAGGALVAAAGAVVIRRRRGHAPH